MYIIKPKMEKRRSTRALRNGGLYEFDIENPDSIEDRKKYSWKRFSFVGVLLVLVVTIICYCGQPPGKRHLKHDYMAEATGILPPLLGDGLKEIPAQPVPSSKDIVAASTQISTTPNAKWKKDQCLKLIEDIRKLKQSGVVIETSAEAQELIHTLQPLLRDVIVDEWGPEPYHVEMLLEFPESMPDYAVAGKDGRIVIELAPISLVPYCVFNFLNIVDNWKVSE